MVVLKLVYLGFINGNWTVSLWFKTSDTSTTMSPFSFNDESGTVQLFTFYINKANIDKLYNMNYQWYWKDIKQALYANGHDMNCWAAHDLRRCFARRAYFTIR